MDKIFKNGNVLTMEEKTPRDEALVVQFDRIYKIGETAEIEKLATPETKVIDLKGQTMLPGFIDAHNHFCLYALLADQADCRPAAGCVRGEDVVEALRAKAANTLPGQWIMGWWGYAPYLLDDKKDLTGEDLDRTTKEHPVCLVHVSVHGAVANSLALRELGFTRETPDPPGGKVHRYANGDPNGILSESAFMGPLFFETPSIYNKMLAGYENERNIDRDDETSVFFSGPGCKLFQNTIQGTHESRADKHKELRTQTRAVLAKLDAAINEALGNQEGLNSEQEDENAETEAASDCDLMSFLTQKSRSSSALFSAVGTSESHWSRYSRRSCLIPSTRCRSAPRAC